MTTACPRAPRGKKQQQQQQQTDPHGEGKKKAAYATNEYTKCLHFGVKQKRFSNRIYTP